MTIFSYTALKNGKEVVTGKIEAFSMKEAREMLRKMNFVPTKIQVQKQGKDLDELSEKKTEIQVKKVRLKPLSTREKIEFTYTLHILLKTGVPLIEGLIFVENNIGKKDSKALAAEIRKLVIAGFSLSDALAKYGDMFDGMYIGLVKAGEETGELDTTLARLHELLEKQDKIKGQIIGTLIYPAFVIGLATLVTLVMLMFVFPAFKDMYDTLGGELPVITAVCMAIGTTCKQYWYLVIAAIFGVIAFLKFIFKWPVSRRKIDEIMLKMPLFDEFVQFAALTNFVSVLKVAYNAGIPIVDSLVLATGTVDNYPLKDALGKVAIKVQGGMHFSAALKSVNIIPQIIMYMISTGEQTGRLGEMMHQAAMFIDESLEKTIESMTKLIEPVMFLFVGVLVMILALALYMPLFQSYQEMM